MRNLILSCVLALLLLFGVLLVVIPARAAATITVTTTSDTVASDGLCSLREAIIAANTDSAFSDCPAGSGADTIVFDSGLPQPPTFVLTNTGANENGALTGDLDIVGTLTISGTGTTIIDGSASDRVFQIRPLARVTISGVSIRNGDPGTGADGGGIAVDLTARLTLSNSIVISNTALTGGGIKVLGLLTMNDSTVTGNQGGGIHNDGGGLTLTNVQITNNTGGYGIRNQNQAPFTFNGGLVSGNQGGGIYNATSSATLNDLTISNNTGGGGVYNSGGTLSHLRINRGVVMTNTAASGAGIFNEGIGAVADIFDARISGNTATAAGGGVFNNGSMTLERSVIDHNQARSGGGIEHFGGTLRLTNATLSSNTASDNGGGLYNQDSAILKNVTLSLNAANGPDIGGNIFNDNAQLSVGNSIVAHSDADGNCFNSDGILNSLGHNLESADTCGFGAAGDMVNTDPLLGPLRDNGGNTLTRALLPGSPAIDNGDDVNCPDTDQRSVPRPQGAHCDIGAFEYLPGADADLSIIKQVNPDPVDAGAALTYTLSISNAGPDAATVVTVKDTLPQGVNFGSAVGSGWNCSETANIVTCTRNSLAVGPAPVVTITVSAPHSGGTITNTATVSMLGQDPDPSNNTDEVASAVNPPSPEQANLALAKRANPDPVLVSTPLTYTLSVTNLGPNTAISVSVTDDLPTGVTFHSVSGSGWVCGHTAGTVTCDRSTLAMGAAPDVVIALLAPESSGLITNTATIGSVTADPNTTNNSASVRSTVLPSFQFFMPLVLRPSTPG